MNFNKIIIDSKCKFTTAISGGGQEVLGELTRYGGMSDSLLEAIVPYHPNAYTNLIGGKPDQIVSSTAARAAAMACYERARRYTSDKDVFGLASTSALVKVGGEREGRKHKVYMAIQDYSRTVDIQITYKSGRTRLEEERLTADCIYRAILWGCRRMSDISRLLDQNDTIKVIPYVSSDPMRDLLHGVIDKWGPSGARAIFSSSFNPIHQSHIDIIEDAAKRLKQNVYLEICITNPDKPPLDYLTLHERLVEMAKLGCVLITNKPLFFEKCQLYPGATFIIGMDTLNRILDPKYYKGGGNEICVGLFNMKRQGNRFLVYPRKGVDLIEGKDEWQKSLVRLAKEVTQFADSFEATSISSTQMRRAAIDVES